MRSGTRSGLLRDRNFLALWLGQAVSEVGSAVTTIVLPLLAVITLSANTAEVGMLRASASFAVLLGAIPAGILVDRSRKRAVMLVCNIGRALVLATIPVFAVFGLVSMVQLYLVAFLTGILAIAFSVAYHAYYPIFVPRADLPDANSKIAATEALARVSGPGVGASLTQAIGAATTILVDIFSYVISTVALLFTRTAGDVARPSRQRVPLRQEAREGFRLVVANSVLARTALVTVTSMFCLFMTDAVFIYYLIHDLRLSSALVGVVFVLGELGGLAAAVLAGRIMRRVGSARIMWLVIFLSPAGYLAAIATPPNAITLASVFMILSSTRFVLFDIAQYSYRQTVCPLDKLGKVTATIRLGVGTAITAGALAGGWLGVLLGARTTIVIATTLACVAGLPVLFSPLRRARDIDELPDVPVPVATAPSDPEDASPSRP